MLRTRGWALTWSTLRLVMALVTASAVIAQGAVTIGDAPALGKDVATTIANFFSFFTILSNIATVIVLIWAALWWFTRGRGRSNGGPDAAPTEPRALALTLASVTTYMVITGIVYNALLRQIALPQGATVPWSNEVLHLVGPLFLLIDLFVAPGRRALPWRAVAEIAVFPILWIVYTLIRGPLTVDPGGRPPYWYPYPFLNPNTLAGGYSGVAVYIVVIAAAVVVVAAIVIAVGRRRASAAALSARGAAGAASARQ